MAESLEKHFSIDAGNGKKMEGCPYSVFEDGHDVQEYIIPPKGYKFIGFKCVMQPENRIYDGRLIAQYEKLPFSDRIMDYKLPILIGIAAIIVIGLIIFLLTRIPNGKDMQSQQLEKAENSIITTDSIKAETPVQMLSEEVTQPADEQVPEADTDINKPEEEPVPVQTVTASSQPSELFKQEFWGLIHQRTLQMDDYTDLYNKYKSQGVSGDEFEYLRLTILKDFATFKSWYPKLRSISVSELQNINTIEDLVKEINKH